MIMSKNGVPVVNRYSSHLHCSIEDVKEALSNIELKDDFIKTTYTFKDKFGYSECVKTTESDEIIFITRRGRKGPTRFVLNRPPEKTNNMTIILMKKDNCYVIITAFWGDGSEPEPWDEKAFIYDRVNGYEKAKQKSIEFWSNHALVYK